MSGRLPERLERRLELVDHDRDEAVEGAEEALDAGVSERQVGQRHDGVATNLDARIPRRRRRRRRFQILEAGPATTVATVGLAFDLSGWLNNKSLLQSVPTKDS